MSKYIVTRTGGKPIPEDEPCFVIRAQDMFAPVAVACYALAVKNSVSAEMREEIIDHIDRIDEWQVKHGVKIPD